MFYIAILVAFSISVVYYYWTRRHLYAASRNIKGPPGLPLIGNALSLAGNLEETFNTLNSIMAQVNNEPIKLWLGPFLLICLKYPEYLEKVMTSPKFAIKHQLYEIMAKSLGNGLISTSGLNGKHKSYRRAIQPMFDLKYVEETLETFQRYTNSCLERLEEHADMKTFNIWDEIHKCVLDFNIETIFGRKADYQDKRFKDFVKAASDFNILSYERMTKVWLFPDFIFRLLPHNTRFQKMVRDLRSYAEEALLNLGKKRKLIAAENNGKTFVSIIERIAELRELNSISMTQSECVDHVLSVFVASENAVSLISSFAIVCFGMYPEYQVKAVEEIRNVIGDEIKTVSLTDLHKLDYLNMCIKDVLRLFPIGPFIVRRVMDDYKLDRWVLPRGSAVLILINNLHRDPLHWKNPDHFHPDHFLPEEVAKRHPYAYIPFSAGPRGCIGKNVAHIQLKQFLVNFLLRYEIEADGKVPDIKLKSDISVRPKDGFMCRIRRRSLS